MPATIPHSPTRIPHSPTRIESTPMDLVRAVDDCAATTAETASVVRHVLTTRRARFAAVPLVEALTRRADTPTDKEERR